MGVTLALKGQDDTLFVQALLYVLGRASHTTMRIAVVTPLLPIEKEPYRGRPLYETIKALQQYAELRVFCAVAVYPSLKNTYTDSLLAEWAAYSKLPLTHFTYTAAPMLSRPWNGDVCARRLYPHLASAKADVSLNFWLYPEGYAGVKVSRELDIPSVVSCRGSDLRRVSAIFAFKRATAPLQMADAVCAVSHELRERALAAGAISPKALTIHNGCDQEIFHHMDLAAVRASLGIAADAEVLLYVGRFAKAKGLKELLAAFASLLGRRPRLILALIGDGPLASTIQNFVRDGGLTDRVRFCGVQAPPEVARWMNAADLLCLPSHSEGCPNVILEALSTGCPAVASDVGGVPELITPECGVLTPVGDAPRLAAAIEGALERHWDRRSISASFSRSWNDVARETHAVCEDLVKRRAARRGTGGRPKRPKITVVTPYFPTSTDSYRGHSAFQTLRFLKDMADVDVICPLATYPDVGWLKGHTTNTFDPAFQAADIPSVYLEYPAIPVLTRPVNGEICRSRIMPLLQRSRPDVILNYWLYPEGYAAVRAGDALGIPVVVGSIGSDLRRIQDLFTKYLVRKTLEGAARVITVSEDLRRIAIQFGVSPDKVTTIVNGYDDSLFYPGDREDARRALGLDRTRKLILFVGSLLETKGLAELVEALRPLVGRRPETSLALIGDGPFRPELERRIQNNGLGAHISLLGRRTSAQVGDWMRAADVFCLPSYSEGCPNVVVEALACGSPVVASDVGGIPELVRNDCGILVPAKAVEPLSAALERALAIDWDRARIGASSHRSWKDVAEETFAICRRVMDIRGASEADHV